MFDFYWPGVWAGVWPAVALPSLKLDLNFCSFYLIK